MRIFKHIAKNISDASPSILIGVGIVAMTCMVIEACKATPEANRILEEKVREKGEDLTVPEKVKAVGKVYAPAGVLGVCAAACFISSNNINVHRNAALASLYTMSQTALQTHQEKLVEAVGQKKADEINDQVAIERMRKTPMSDEDIIKTRHGDKLFFSVMSGKFFESDIESIRSLVNDFNIEMFNGCGYASANDWEQYYLEIGKMKYTGDAVGWNLNITGPLDPKFTWATVNGVPACILDYNNPPEVDYAKWR